jgi:SAM-dependent methyltransferase
MKRDPHERIDWVYSSQTNDELKDRYHDWAGSYESDLAEHFEYRAHQVCVADFVGLVPVSAKVLDAGAGTGLVGQLLAEHGYRDLFAMDLSPAMLAEAERKGVYQDLRPGVLGSPLDYPDDHFEAVISVGVFTAGHAPASGFDELIRVVRPGGWIIFTLNNVLDVPEGEFPQKLAALSAAGRWTLINKGERFQPTPLGEPDVQLRVWRYQVS